MLIPHLSSFNFYIKPHPRSNKALIKNYLKGKQARLETDLNSFDLLRCSDKVMGMTSIMLSHSLALKKDTLSLQPNRTSLGKERSNYYYDAILAKSNEDISSFLKSKVKQENIICTYNNACCNIYKTIMGL